MNTLEKLMTIGQSRSRPKRIPDYLPGRMACTGARLEFTQPKEDGALTTEDQEYLARLVGRDIAQERALLPLIGSSQAGDTDAFCGVLQMNFEMGRTQIPGRLNDAGLPPHLQRMAEEGFYRTTRAILDGVRSGKYVVPAR